MKWAIRILPFVISGALAIVDLSIFNENITKPKACPNVQYACPRCPFGQQCVYPNSGGCDGAGIPVCQAIKGCFGQICLIRALPCPKECPFFCEYKGPPCCPFIGQPVCKPQCQTFAPCKVTKCPKECPDDCFYPNASTCCPKSGQAVCKNKRRPDIFPPTTTVETTSTTNDEPKNKKHTLQNRSNTNYRRNHHPYEREAYYGGRNGNRYNGGYYKQRGVWPKTLIETKGYATRNSKNEWWNDYGLNVGINPLPPVPEKNVYNNGYPGPEAAIDYFPIPGYKPTVPDTKNTYDNSVKNPYANDMNDRFIPKDNNDYYLDIYKHTTNIINEWHDGNGYPPKDLYPPPPVDPVVVTVTERITECEVTNSPTVDTNDEKSTPSSITHHICPMFIRTCPPECPHDCIYPTDAPCPYAMKPSCPPKKGEVSSEKILSNDDLPKGNTSLGVDPDPSPIAELQHDIEDVKTIVTQPIDIDMESHDGNKIGIVPLKQEAGPIIAPP